MKICLDPGHGGKDPGAINDVFGHLSKESNINLIICSLVLRNPDIFNGHEVIMTRKNDTTLSLEDRVSIASNNGCDLFISLHCNASTNNGVEGHEVFYHQNSRKGCFLAEKLNTMYSNNFPELKNRKTTPNASFYVLRYTRMPAILFEMEFMSNVSSLAHLHINQLQIADTVIDFIKSL